MSNYGGRWRKSAKLPRLISQLSPTEGSAEEVKSCNYVCTSWNISDKYKGQNINLSQKFSIFVRLSKNTKIMRVCFVI